MSYKKGYSVTDNHNSKQQRILPVWFHRSSAFYLMLAIVGIALVLRIWGNGFGLPQRYHIDEAPYILAALRIGQGDLHITYPYNSPNIFQFILTAEYGLLFLAGRLLGQFQSPAQLAGLYRTDPSIFYLLARTTSAVFGVITVVISYFAGKQLYGRAVGLIAALILATTFIHVRDSHYAVTDILITLLVLLCLHGSIKYVDKVKFGWLGMAGLAGGAAIGLKYLPAPILIAPILSVLVVHDTLSGSGWWQTLRTIVLWLGSVLAGFVFAFPAPLISPELFSHHITQAFGQAANPLGGLLIDDLPAWLYYGQTLRWGFGIPLLIAVFGGVVLTALRRETKGLIWLAGAASYFSGLLFVNTYFARYILPLVPLLVVLGAGFILFCANMIGSKMNSRLAARSLLFIFTLLVLAYPTLASIRHNQLLQKGDTRTIAKNWIEENIPEDTVIVSPWFGPPLSTAGDPEPASQRIFEVLSLDPFTKDSAKFSINHYQDLGAEYLVLNNYFTNVRLDDPGINESRMQFYNTLANELDVVAEFEPTSDSYELPLVFDELYGPAVALWQRERPGPSVTIYRLTE